jgi:Rieske 2Fe-2S family protein
MAPGLGVGTLVAITVARSSRGALTLPAEDYTSQRVHDLERERIFDRHWLCAGLVAYLPEPGSYFLAEIEGESLILVRDHDGAIRGFYNICRHRGTRLCRETTGTLRKHIVCPYHSWAYDFGGDLVSAPNMVDTDGFDQADYPLHPVSVAIWGGLVFINFQEHPEPFEKVCAPLLSRFDRWRLPELEPVQRREYELECNWKLLVQNYSECYHCPTLHPALNKLSPYRDASNELEEGLLLGGPMRLAKDTESMTTDGRACAAALGDPPDEERAIVHYYVLFPTLFLSFMPDFVMIHRLMRRGPARTSVICEWLFAPEAVRAPGFDATRAVEFWDTVNRQDWGICEFSQQGIGSRSYRPGPYGNLESLLPALDREYLRALEA